VYVRRCVANIHLAMSGNFNVTIFLLVQVEVCSSCGKFSKFEKSCPECIICSAPSTYRRGGYH